MRRAILFRSSSNPVGFGLRTVPLSAISFYNKLRCGSFVTGINLFGTSTKAINPDNNAKSESSSNTFRLSKLLAQHSLNLTLSRREAERLIQEGNVSVAGEVVESPHFLLSWQDAANNSIKVGEKVVQFSKHETDKSNNIQVWIAHKLPGEIVTNSDPQGRPSLIDRLLKQKGLGKKPAGGEQKAKPHLKAVGRLDMASEGLILITNDGQFARDLELPYHKVHRTYRVRVHGFLTPHKLRAMRRGLTIDNVHYGAMKVQLETVKSTRRSSQREAKNSSTNQWLRITCTEGKNRQIRRVMKHLGLMVTRLIRISYGDYQLDSIPPGAAVQAPVKKLEDHKRRGALVVDPTQRRRQSQVAKADGEEGIAKPIQWITHVGTKT